MELNDILNDIQGTDAVPEASVSGLPSGEPPAMETVPEEVEASVLAVENYKTRLRCERIIKTNSTLDRSVATEIFTMLPELSDPVLMTKLTNAASAHNKTLLQQRLEKDGPIYNGEVMSAFDHLYSALSDAMEDLEAVEPVMEAISEQISRELKRISNPAEIVFCRKKIDLRQAPFSEILQVNDQLIDYTPYAGVLVESFQTLYCSYGLYALFPGNNSQLSLIAITERLNRATISLAEKRHRLDNFRDLSNTCGYYDEIAVSTYEFEELLTICRELKVMKHIYLTDTRFIDALLHLLKIMV